MNLQGLQKALTRTGTAVSIATDTLGKSFGDFLDRYYFNQGRQIVIDNAEVATDEAQGVITVTGRADFLPVANLPVTARFSVDSAGAVQAVVTYTLIDKSGSSAMIRSNRALNDSRPPFACDFARS